MWSAEYFHCLLSGLNVWADTLYLLYSCRGQCGFSYAQKVKSPRGSRITNTVPGNTVFFNHITGSDRLYDSYVTSKGVNTKCTGNF